MLFLFAVSASRRTPNCPIFTVLPAAEGTAGGDAPAFGAMRATRPPSPMRATRPASPSQPHHTRPAQPAAGTAQLQHSDAASGQRLASGCSFAHPSHSSRPITLAHVNINSITAPDRLDELETFADTHDIDIMCLTETKLDNAVNTSLYHMNNFSPPLTKHRDRHGGGVAIYTKNNLAVTRLIELELDAIEWIWAKVRTSGHTFIVCCVYLPPHLTASDHINFLDKFTDSVARAQMYNPSAVLILGDLNVGNIFLDDKFTENHSGITNFDKNLKDTLLGLDLVQMIDHPTRISGETANLRDLVIVSDTDKVVDNGILSSFSQLDHFPTYVSLKCTRPESKTSLKNIWDYKRMNIDLFIDLLIHTDWDGMLEKDVNEATVLITQAIQNAARQAIPQKTIKTDNRDKPWITLELKLEINRRNRLFRRAKSTQTQRSWAKWKAQRNIVTELNRTLKAKHICNQVNKLTEYKQHPRQYHQVLKNILSKKNFTNIPPLECTNGQLVTDDISKANLLNNYFAEQSSNECSGKPVPRCVPEREVPILDRIFVSEHEVLTVLNKINVNKSCGADRIPNKMLKLAAIIIKDPLTKLFNKSLSEGVYPSLWKHAKITPIYKNKGAQSDPKNYRPISLLPSLSKVFEKLVFAKIYAHLDTNGLITDRQSGYRPHHGTQTQLIYLTDTLYKALDKNMDLTTIYLDISRYFDKIWHAGLLAKCKYQCGIMGDLLKWLESYLENRTHSVTLDTATSSTQTINAGCPQGSVLGPLLALIYLNDLDGVTDNNLLFFADDTLLFKTHPHDSDDATISLQNDLDKIKQFGDKWAITFNSSKTTQQTFTNKPVKKDPKLRFGNIDIPVENSHKHLGLTFSSSLRFHDHVNDIIKKVNAAIGPLYPIARYVPREILNKIYCTYARPFFDYSDIVYHGLLTATDTMRLERLQNRAARLVTGALFRTSTDRLLTDLGWTTLRTRREVNCLTFMYKMTNARFCTPPYLTAALPATRDQATFHKLRNASNLSLPANRLSSYKNSFIPRTVRAWNNLPVTIRSKPSLSSFKRAVFREYGAQRPPAFFAYGLKKSNILHTRLRLDASELNAHLFKIQSTKTSTPYCTCRHTFETTKHFLLYCPLYNVKRITMETSISAIITSFSTSTPQNKLNIMLNGQGLSDADGLVVARAVQKYILDTGRFR